MDFLKRQKNDPSLPTDLTPAAPLAEDVAPEQAPAQAPAPAQVIARRRVAEVPEASVEFEVVGELADDYV